MVTELLLYENVPAPVSVGDTVGTVRYLIDGNVIAESAVTAAEEAEKIGFLGIFKKMLGIYLLK